MAIVMSAVISIAWQDNASATLLNGKTVEYQYFFPDLSSPWFGADNGNKTVGSGIEVNNFVSNNGTIDISDTNILVDYTVGFSSIRIPAAFNGFRIKDILNDIDSFTNVIHPRSRWLWNNPYKGIKMPSFQRKQG